MENEIKLLVKEKATGKVIECLKQNTWDMGKVFYIQTSEREFHAYMKSDIVITEI